MYKEGDFYLFDKNHTHTRCEHKRNMIRIDKMFKIDYI